MGDGSAGVGRLDPGRRGKICGTGGPNDLHWRFRHVEAEPAEDALDLTGGDVDAEMAPHLRAAQRDGLAFRLTSNCVDTLAIECAAGAGEDQLGNSITRQRGDAVVGAALEAM